MADKTILDLTPETTPVSVDVVELQKSAGGVGSSKKVTLDDFKKGLTLESADIHNTPAGDIAATNVQAALNELDTEKMATATYDPTGVAGDAFDSGNTVFDPTGTGLTKTNVQDQLGELAWMSVTVTSDVNPAIPWVVYKADASAGLLTISLPDVSVANANKQFRVLKIANTNDVTVTTVGGTQLIGTETSQSIVIEGVGLTVQANLDTLSYDIIQDSRSATVSGTINFYGLTEASTIVPFNRGAVSTTDPDYSPISSDLAPPLFTGLNNMIGGFISDEGVIQGEIIESVFNASSNVRRVSGKGFIYFELYKYELDTTETLLGTSSVSAKIDKDYYQEFQLSGVIIDQVFLPTDRLLVKLYGSVDGAGDCELEIRVEGENPSRITIPVPTGSISHNTLAGVNDAAAGVTKGHINAVAQTIAGVKTFDDGIIVNGDIIQSGSIYETHAEQVYSTKDEIILRDGAIAGLAGGAYTGVRAKLYDGVNDGLLVFDNGGVARVGDVGSLQAIATREDTPTDNAVAYFDTATQQFKTDSNIYTDGTNVGIGTTTQVVRLEARDTTASSLPATTGTTPLGVVQRIQGAGATILDTGIDATGGKVWLQGTSATDLSETRSLLLNPNGGDVGIGTSTPGIVTGRKVLTINGTSGAEIHLNGGEVQELTFIGVAGTGVIRSNTGYLRFDTEGAAEKMRITTAGDVGIGTTAPDTKLHISGLNDTSNTNIQAIRITDEDSASAVDQVVGRLEFESSDAGGSGVGSYIQGVIEDISGSQYLSLGTGAAGASAERMRISSNGNVGIGTSAPGYALHVKKDSSVLAAEVWNTSAVSGYSGLRARTTATDSGTNIFTAYSNDTKFAVRADGVVTVGTSYTAPTIDNEVATKKYVDDNGGGGTAVITGGYGGGSVSNNTTVYIGLGSIAITNATESNVQIPYPRSGTLQNFRFHAGANLATSDIILTVRKNGVATGIAVVLTGSTSGTFSDLVNTVSIAAGDLISLEFSSVTGSGAITGFGYSIELL